MMLKRYGFLGSLRLLKSLVLTKIFFSKARLIRFPFDIRNANFINLGENMTTGFGCRIEAFPEKLDTNSKVLNFGNNVQLNDYVHIAARGSVTIGNNVLMASKIFVTDIVHGNYSEFDPNSSPDIFPSLRPLTSKPVIIEDNVWLGEFVSILPGVTIGKGSIIGANSVVSKDIPENVIAVGSPARPIKKFNLETKRWEKFV